MIVKVKGLYKTFYNHYNKKHIDNAICAYRDGVNREEIYKKYSIFIANSNINLDIYKNEILIIMGVSGCGKSTFIRCLNGIYKIDAGSVLVDGMEINEINKRDLSNLRKNKFAMVFQNFGLLPHRNVIKNVTYGLEVKRVPKKLRIERAREILKFVGLETSEYKYINELSGGMKQRVGIARALVVDPDILLMDEAFSALDPLTRNEMQSELVKLVCKLQKTVVFITHDLIEAFKLGHRIAFMKDGEIIQVGKPLDILEHPKTDFIRDFLKNLPILSILKIKDVLETNFLLGTAHSFQNSNFNVIINKENDEFIVYNRSMNETYNKVLCLDIDINSEIKNIVQYLNSKNYLLIEENYKIIGYVDLKKIVNLLIK